MAEEEKPEPAPVQASPPQAPGAADLALMVKLLAQQQAPVTSTATAVPVQPEATEAAAQAGAPMFANADFSNIPTQMKIQELHRAAQLKPVSPMSLPKVAPVNQIPVPDVMRMYAHQLTPHVEAAKQRMLQALMQRTRGITPPPPPVAPTAKV